MSEEQETKTAKLVIIGNGFDLAHGYKTGYNHFICDLLFKEVCRAHQLVQDCLSNSGDIERRENFKTHFNFKRNYEYTNEIAEEFINEVYFSCRGRNGLNDTENALQKLDETFARMKKDLEIQKDENNYHPSGWLAEINLNCKRNSYLQNEIYLSSFLKALIEDDFIQGWVNVEDAYYSEIKKIHKDSLNQPKSKRYQIQQAKRINSSFTFLTEKLEEYLLRTFQTDQGVRFLMGNKFKLHKLDEDRIQVGTYAKVIVLNFNYSNIAYKYITPQNRFDIEVIDIHGALESHENPIIFGVGDENHTDYKKLEESNINDFLVNVKSIKYLETHNYRNLINVLNKYDEFDVDIIGHSCGISDRTLLKEIFEMEECKDINIHHYSTNGDNGLQNYKDISYGVSRYFENNMEMRRKVKSYDATLTIPQYQEPQVDN